MLLVRLERGRPGGRSLRGDSIGAPISRVLSGSAAGLRANPSSPPRSPERPSVSAHASPQGSCSLPEAPGGRAAPRPRTGFAPAWPCFRWGLPGRRHCCRRRWSLTPPFHPYLADRESPPKLNDGDILRWARRSVSVALSAGRPARVLPGIVLWEARTFLKWQRHLRPLGAPMACPILPGPSWGVNAPVRGSAFQLVGRGLFRCKSPGPRVLAGPFAPHVLSGAVRPARS